MENNMTDALNEVCQAVKGGAIGVLAYFATIHYGIIFAVIIMAFIDVIIGSRYAKKQGDFESRQFRNGILDKVTEFLFIIVTAIMEYVSTEVFVGLGIPFLPITNLLAGWLIYKDYGSIVETLILSGHDLPDWIVKGYKVNQNRIDNMASPNSDEDNKEE